MAVQVDNLHYLSGSGRPMLVVCKKCGHRAAIPPEKVGAGRGDMKELRHLKLKYSKCEAKEFEAFVVHSDERVQLFLEGQDLFFFRERPRPTSGGPTFS